MNSKTENEKSILKLLYQVGQIRTSDFSLFLLNLYDQTSAARRTVKRLLENGIIEKKEYKIKPTDNNRKGTDSVYCLTEKGRRRFFEGESDRYYKSLRPMLSPKGEGEQSDKTRKMLTDIGIMAMLRACNVPVFPHEKPSLLYLRDTLVGSIAFPKPGYMDNISKDLCFAGLACGIYYTVSEYLDYIKSAYPSSYDTILGTRIRGLFISNKSCFAIYTSEKYNNRIMKVNLKGENGLIDSLQSLREFTNVFRALPSFDELGVLKNGRTYIKERAYNRPYALIFSDGESLAYSVATGYSRGKRKRKSTANATIGIEKAYKSGGKTVLSKQTTFLTAASGLYSKMYVVPTDTNGFYELNYLLSHSLEETKSAGCRIMEQESRLFKSDTEIIGDFSYSCTVRGQRVPVMYMPVFEAKRLYKIANTDENPIIITNAHLLNMIAHSIRKEGRYYNYETMKAFGKNDCYIYDEGGHIKGKHILETFMNQQGNTFVSNSEPHKLPKKFGLSSLEFYNKIARGDIKPADIAGAVSTREYIPQSGKRKRSVIMNISINEDLAKLVKENAVKEGVSASRYISNCLRKSIS